MRRYNFLLQFLCSALLCSFSNYSNGTHLQRCTEAPDVLLGRHFHCEEQQQQQQYLPQQHFVVTQTADSCPRARRNGTLGMGLGGNMGASGQGIQVSPFLQHQLGLGPSSSGMVLRCAMCKFNCIERN